MLLMLLITSVIGGTSLAVNQPMNLIVFIKTHEGLLLVQEPDNDLEDDLCAVIVVDPERLAIAA